MIEWYWVIAIGVGSFALGFLVAVVRISRIFRIY